MIKIVTVDGQSPSQGISSILAKIKSKLDTESGKISQSSMLWTVKNHVQTIYPNSQHYSPEKVTENSATGRVGVINIDIPGITRAYHDIDIYPKRSKSLTIPLHRDAYGKNARSFQDLFVVKKKNGKAFLARHNGGSIEMMYVLSKHVHQNQDTRLMPSDETLATNIFSRLKAYLTSLNIH